jgi:hypothetical protein
MALCGGSTLTPFPPSHARCCAGTGTGMVPRLFGVAPAMKIHDNLRNRRQQQPLPAPRSVLEFYHLLDQTRAESTVPPTQRWPCPIPLTSTRFKFCPGFQTPFMVICHTNTKTGHPDHDSLLCWRFHPCTTSTARCRCATHRPSRPLSTGGLCHESHRHPIPSTRHKDITVRP